MKHRMLKNVAIALTSAFALGGCAYQNSQQGHAQRLAYIAEKLDLTLQQRAAVEKVLTRWTTSQQEVDGAWLMDEITGELRRDRFDRARIKTLLTSRSQKFEKLIPELAADMAALHEILTPEQRARLSALLEERRERGRHHAAWRHNQ